MKMSHAGVAGAAAAAGAFKAMSAAKADVEAKIATTTSEEATFIVSPHARLRLGSGDRDE
jgi:hypothetical protein